MKSAIELAMERSGGENRKLSDEQKKGIAEVRSKTAAKLAQEEIMFREALSKTSNPAERDDITERYSADIRKIEAKGEEEIERIRKG